jgi:hypothetical protein
MEPSTKERTSTGVLRSQAVFWSMAYGLLYVIVHVLGVIYDPYLALLPQRDSLSWTSWVPAVTIGMATALLTLSFAMFIAEEVFNVAMASKAAVMNVVLIYVVGQIFILVLGHLELFAAAKYRASPHETVGGVEVWGKLSSLSGFISITVGLLFLVILENYIARIMGLMQDRLGEHASEHTRRARYLWVCALVSILITILKYVLSAFDEVGKDRLTQITLVLEAVIFGVSIWITRTSGRKQAPDNAATAMQHG